MNYIVDGKQFIVHYQELKAQYLTLVELTDEEFLCVLPQALHLAIMIAWFKELDAQDVLSDTGLIHELAHLIHNQEDSIHNLQEIREAFRVKLELA